MGLIVAFAGPNLKPLHLNLDYLPCWSPTGLHRVSSDEFYSSLYDWWCEQFKNDEICIKLIPETIGIKGIGEMLRDYFYDRSHQVKHYQRQKVSQKIHKLLRLAFL